MDHETELFWRLADGSLATGAHMPGNCRSGGDTTGTRTHAVKYTMEHGVSDASVAVCGRAPRHFWSAHGIGEEVTCPACLARLAKRGASRVAGIPQEILDARAEAAARAPEDARLRNLEEEKREADHKARQHEEFGLILRRKEAGEAGWDSDLGFLGRLLFKAYEQEMRGNQ